MKDSIKELGRTIYKTVEDNGAPWSLGTIALISGFSLRLINFSIVFTTIKTFSPEIKTFFTLCDDDDKVFDQYLDNKKTNPNSIGIKILYLILSILEDLTKGNFEIKNNLIVDFRIGIQFLITSANQVLKILEANDFEQVTKEQYEDWLLRIKELESYFNDQLE